MILQTNFYIQQLYSKQLYILHFLKYLFYTINFPTSIFTFLVFYILFPLKCNFKFYSYLESRIYSSRGNILYSIPLQNSYLSSSSSKSFCDKLCIFLSRSIIFNFIRVHYLASFTVKSFLKMSIKVLKMS